MNVIIFIPAFNEAATIGKVVRSAGHNVLVIDDGSRDQTAEIAKKAGAQVYRHPINCGVGAALATGFDSPEAFQADVVVIMDADGQHHAEDVEAVLAPIVQGRADVVIGSRFLCPNRIPLLRRFFNKIANIVSFTLSGVWLTDSQSGFRAFSKKALSQIRTRSGSFHFFTELNREIGQKGLAIKEVPIRTTYSSYSLSKGQNFSTGLETFFKLILEALLR